MGDWSQWTDGTDEPEELNPVGEEPDYDTYRRRHRRENPWEGWLPPGLTGGPVGRGQTPPPWVAGLLGLGQQHRPGPKVRRGDVRMAILGVLADADQAGEPINGYQVIQQIADRSGEVWKPSPGSVYPTIQQLQDEGLVEADEERGRRTLRLTDVGRQYAADRGEDLEAVWTPFRRHRDGEGPAGAIGEVGQVMSAIWQIVSQGSASQKKALSAELTSMRRRLYAILGEDPDGSGREGDDEPQES